VTAEEARREFDVEVTWLPFDLHPEYPPEGIALSDLHARYGIGVGEQDPMRSRFEAAGLVYDRPETVPNTRLALRLTELARELGMQEPFHHRLMQAYWSEAVDIGEADELRRLAREVGLDGAEVERVIADPSAYLDVVHGSTAQAQSIGINAIPAFLLDRRLILLGAQPLEVFRRAFDQVSSSS
jgi:predicted DsbA family dithiol-disulfide isomerase